MLQINQIRAAVHIHLSIGGAPISSEGQGPAPSLGDPRSQLRVSGASPKPPDILYRLDIPATKSWDKSKSDQCVSVIVDKFTHSTIAAKLHNFDLQLI